MIPTWLINWAAKVAAQEAGVEPDFILRSSLPPFLPPSLTQTGVPQFLDMMRKAVFGYSDFLEARRQELGLEKLDNAERMKNLYGVDESTVPESLKQEYLQRQCT